MVRFSHMGQPCAQKTEPWNIHMSDSELSMIGRPRLSQTNKIQKDDVYSYAPPWPIGNNQSAAITRRRGPPGIIKVLQLRAAVAHRE